MTQVTTEMQEPFIGMKGVSRNGTVFVLSKITPENKYFGLQTLTWVPEVKHKHIPEMINTYYNGLFNPVYLGRSIDVSEWDIVEWELKDAKEEEKDNIETECDIGSKELSASINKIYITQQVGDATLHINIESNEPLIELVCAAATLLNQD